MDVFYGLFHPWLRDPGSRVGKKSGSGWTTRIRFPRAYKPFFLVKRLKYFDAILYLGWNKFRSGIRDPGWRKFWSGIRKNILYPQHWCGFLLNTVVWNRNRFQKIKICVSYPDKNWGGFLIMDQLNRNPDPKHCFKVPVLSSDYFF